MLDIVKCTTLSDGPPKDYFCVVPTMVSDRDDGVALTIKIDNRTEYDDEEELLADDDDDGGYNEDGDED
ncbi:hypothetical protein ACP70R_030371 [Stipagrostis hirtigluma subsp. patula]